MATLKLKNADPFPGKHATGFKLFCFAGPNDGLINQRIGNLQLALSNAASGQITIVDLDGDDLASEPDRLLGELSTTSLFAEDRFIRVRLGNKSALAAIEAALPILPQCDGTTAAIDAGTNKRHDDLIRLITGSPACALVKCEADTKEELAAFARAGLKDMNVGISDELARELVDMVDGDRSLLKGEMTKLAALAEQGGDVDRDLLHEAVADESSSAVDQAVRQIFTGQLAAALDTYDRQGSLGADSAQIVNALLRQALATHREMNGGWGQKGGVSPPAPRRGRDGSADMRRMIARLADVVQLSRSSDKLLDDRAEDLVLRISQFFTR